jgi:hypothetical protein
MAQRKLTCITNISLQVVPVMLSSIALSKADSGSSVAYNKDGALSIPPGQQIDVESSRLDDGQLVQLRTMNLITTTIR